VEILETIFPLQTCVIEPWWRSCRWGETTSLNCSPQRAYCSSPGWYVSVENHRVMISAGESSRFIRQNTLAVLPPDSSTCRKIVWHGANGLTSLPEGRHAVDFYHPRPGLNPRTPGPMASTLAITPSRMTISEPKSLVHHWSLVMG
jgi:hypothetical protein